LIINLMNGNKSKLIKIFFFSLVAVIFFEGASFTFENKIVLKINNEAITTVDIYNEMKYLKTLNKKLNNLNDNEIISLAKNSLIREKVKEIELLKYPKVDVNKEYLESIVKNIYKNLGLKNKEEFINYLNEYSIDINDVEKKLTNEALWNQLIFEKFHKKIIINKENIKKEIETVKKFTVSYNLNEILYFVKKKGDQKKIFEEIKESIKNNGFENTASLFSESENSKTGGKIGWINEGSINKKILNELIKLKIGEYTAPIQTPAGFLILNLVNKKKIERTYNMAEELSIRIKNLQNQQLNQYSNIYFNKIKKDIRISEK
tara:strand:- start:245 stop:1201 length:957 start_codon:yes stop_codon:yes gene_type:complete